MGEEALLAESRWAAARQFLPLVLLVVFAVPAMTWAVSHPSFGPRHDDYPVRINFGGPEPRTAFGMGAIVDAIADVTGAASDDSEADLTPPKPEEQKDFATAFAGFAGEKPAKQQSISVAAKPVETVKLGSHDVMKLDFDLTPPADDMSDGLVIVRKQVVAKDRSLGSVSIAIDQASRLYLARDEVAGLLPERAAAIGGLDQKRVPIARLRELGVDLRYDPVSDQLILAS